MAKVICHTCLRTDISVVDLSTELAYFIDELCDYNIIEHPRYKYCTICVHLLTKFYNFKQRCLKACKILKSLKGKQKLFPNNLHEQIPTSIGPCSILTPFMLLEHEHDPDQLETKPDLHFEPNISLNNKEASKQNLTADSILTDPISVKDEPMDEVPESDTETLHVSEKENFYINTTSDGNTNIESNFEEEINRIKLEENNDELNIDSKNVNEKCNTKKSKINDYLREFEEEIKNFGDNNEDADEMEFLDTSMLNSGPSQDVGKGDYLDDESLNSMDDIDSDSDKDLSMDDKDLSIDNNDLQMDDNNSESDSDTDSLCDIIERAKNKKININEINDLELAQLLLKVDRKNKLLKARVKYLKFRVRIKNDMLNLFVNDEYDLGDGLKISKEVFEKMMEQYEKSRYHHYSIKGTSNKTKTDDFIRNLYKIYNPEYETVFDIEYLDTEEKKLQEFERRKDSKEYTSAPYKCTRCYKGFYREGLLEYHMKKHQESLGPYSCHICSLRFTSVALQRSHGLHCHTAVYMCRLCQVSFYYINTMRNHFDVHKGVQYPCTVCHGVYRSWSSLATHKRTHATSHICTTCAKSFVSQNGLLFHRKIKHKGIAEVDPSAVVTCGICSLKLDSQKAYKSHQRISHNSDGNIYCHCGESFETTDMLRQHKVVTGHQYTHLKNGGNNGPYVKRIKSEAKQEKSEKKIKTKVKMRICPICQEEVPNKYGSSLYWHFAEHHPGMPYDASGISERHLLCDQCGKRFCNPTVFKDHKNTHLGLRSFICGKCPARFACRHRRSIHRAQHRTTFACELCGKVFKTWAHRYTHMKVHENVRSFKCKICGKGFVLAAALREHVRGVHLRQKRIRNERSKGAKGAKPTKS